MKTIDFGSNFDIIDEINEPKGMKSRLIQNHNTKSYAIQTWGYMSDQWITSQRYKDVLEMWQKNKSVAASIVNQKKVRKNS